ncbi:unnamed protein product, partial [Pylaiella littoralis]
MVYHAVNSSRGNAMSLAVRHSKVSATVELLRAVAISGAYLSPKRLQELEDVCAQVRSTALDVLSGIDGAEGGLRTEVTYLCNTDRQTAVDLSGVFELMCGDLVGEVFGVENGGWNDAEASLSLPASSVYCLMHALFARSLESMRYGFGGQRVADPDSGDVLREQLPLGYLPSLAESILRTDAKAIRLPAGVGSALRAGQAASGFLALGTDAKWMFEPGGDKRVPYGTFVARTGRRRVSGFAPGSHEFLSKESLSLPAKTRGADLLRDGGGRLLSLMQSVIGHIMADAAAAVLKKGLLSAEVSTVSTWQPTEEELAAKNAELATLPDMAGKRFEVEPRVRPASTYFGNLLPSLGGRSLEQMPSPYVTVFNSVLQAFCAAPEHAILTPAITRMWFLVLLEAVLVEEYEMKILPKATKKRVFELVGKFSR